MINRRTGTFSSNIWSAKGTAPPRLKTAQRAIAMLSREAFDLVLLDVAMPEMEGYLVLEHMKADPQLRHLPVIMISAVDEIETVAALH